MSQETARVPGPAPFRLGDVAFWIALLLLPLPIWCFHYFPTQDGPAHLFNGLILRDLATPGNRYQEFFSVQCEPLPNWTAQGVLFCLLHLFPPLVAEKILVTVYLLLFGLGVRYFLSAIRPGEVVVPVLALPLAYNRCLWMGFYNYCLSLDLCLFCLGFFLRRRAEFTGRHGLVLALLFLLTYFSHLVGFLLAAASILILACAAKAPLRSLALIALAAWPACTLSAMFLADSGSGNAFLFGTSASLEPGQFIPAAEKSLHEFAGQLFGPLVEVLPSLGWITLGAYVVVGVIVLVGALASRFRPGPTRLGLAFTVLWLLLAMLYVATPDFLSFEQGGHIKQRLAPLLLGIFLALLPQPLSAKRAPIIATGFLFVLVVLAATFQWIGKNQHALEEYTAGVGAVPSGSVFLSLQGQNSWHYADPLRHAASYYALDGAINLANYEAATGHFPIIFRDEQLRGRGRPEEFLENPAVDTFLFWDTDLLVYKDRFAGFRPTFSQGRLSIYRKQ